MAILQSNSGQRVTWGLWVSSLGALLIAALAMMSTMARAHEVQPSVMDITVTQDIARIDVAASVEPFLAGVDLAGLDDTNSSDRSEENDRLRALPPAELEAAFREAWPDLQSAMFLRVDGQDVRFDLDSVSVPEVGNVELPRTTTFTATAQLPEGDAPVMVVWDSRLGGVAVRQQGLEQEGYTAYLSAGGETAEIPRVGARDESWIVSLLAYVPVGFEHIVPLGLDHILFVLGLFFLSTKLGPLLWQVTAFTAAHTVTLALAALGVLSVPAAVVEPLIAASIVYVGVENVLARGLSPWRPLVVLLFGLLHGLGFASVLTDYGLGSQNFAAKLIGFNLGVEIGQLAVIAVAFTLVLAAMREFGRAVAQRGLAALYLGLAFVAVPAAFGLLATLGFTLDGGLLPLAALVAVLLGLTGAALASDGDDSYRQTVANPASILIALTGAYWFVERVFL